MGRLDVMRYSAWHRAWHDRTFHFSSRLLARGMRLLTKTALADTPPPSDLRAHIAAAVICPHEMLQDLSMFDNGMGRISPSVHF